MASKIAFLYFVVGFLVYNGQAEDPMTLETPHTMPTTTPPHTLPTTTTTKHTRPTTTSKTTTVTKYPSTTGNHSTVTTEVHTTKTPVSTTLPPPGPKAETWFVNSTTGNVCILLKALINMTFIFPNTNSSTEHTVFVQNATATGNCNVSHFEQLITLMFFDNWHMAFTFVTDKVSYRTSQLSVFYDLKNFPDKKIHESGNGTILSDDIKNLTWNRNGLFYQCDVDRIIYSNKTSGKALIRIDVSDLKLEAFRKSHSDKFNSDGTDCKEDKRKGINNLIPIIVGSVLGGLILIVLIAYLISRRKRRSGYESV